MIDPEHVVSSQLCRTGSFDELAAMCEPIREAPLQILLTGTQTISRFRRLRCLMAKARARTGRRNAGSWCWTGFPGMGPIRRQPSRCPGVRELASGATLRKNGTEPCCSTSRTRFFSGRLRRARILHPSPGWFFTPTTPSDLPRHTVCRPAVRLIRLQEGGVSRFCSLAAVHERPAREAVPKLLARLYQHMLWDRQAEPSDGAPKVAAAPIRSKDENRRLTGASSTQPPPAERNEVPGRGLDKTLDPALEAFSTTGGRLRSSGSSCRIERRQQHYVKAIGTSRTTAMILTSKILNRLKIHGGTWLRTWHRDAGWPSYDG